VYTAVLNLVNISTQTADGLSAYTPTAVDLAGLVQQQLQSSCSTITYNYALSYEMKYDGDATALQCMADSKQSD
jgi:hypothetical protein